LQVIDVVELPAVLEHLPIERACPTVESLHRHGHRCAASCAQTFDTGEESRKTRRRVLQVKLRNELPRAITHRNTVHARSHIDRDLKFVGFHTCASSCNRNETIRTSRLLTEPHRLRAPSRQTSRTMQEDGGGISEPSGRLGRHGPHEPHPRQRLILRLRQDNRQLHNLDGRPSWLSWLDPRGSSWLSP